jgi:hypothetical protein
LNRRTHRLLRAALAMLLPLAAASAAAAQAKSLQPLPDEEARLKACEKSVCEIILNKQAKGKDPSCDITKTWSQSTIKQGESKSVSWGFGDARCTASIEIDRAQILAALTQPRYTMRVPTQTVKCHIVQEGELKPIVAKASPKLKFKDGQADKVWINLEKIDGPENVAGTISTIAAMEDKFGIFHKSMLKSINKFIHKRCAQKYGPDAEKETASTGKDGGKDKGKPGDKGKTAGAKPEKASPDNAPPAKKAAP